MATIAGKPSGIAATAKETEARKHPSGANQLSAMAEQGMVPI